MRIFAFLGPARAGKTTAADALEDECRERGFYVERLSMAAPIKDGMRRCGVTKEEKPDEYRSLAQRWGATRRERNENHYVNKARRKLERYAQTERADYDRLDKNDFLDCWDETVVIIDDIRYVNEVELMGDCNATLCWIDAGDRIDLSEEFRKHEAEALANRLHEEEDLLDAVLDAYDGWVIDATEGIPEMEKQLNTFCTYVWFGVFEHLGAAGDD